MNKYEPSAYPLGSQEFTNVNVIAVISVDLLEEGVQFVSCQLHTRVVHSLRELLQAQALAAVIVHPEERPA